MRVGVIGGGRMGAGIAQVFLGIGADVVLVEAGADAAAAACERVRAGLAKAAERGALTEPVAVVEGRLRLVEDLAELPTDADLVVEAVPELPSLKIDILARAEQAIGPATVLATNTSSLSIDELAAALDRPARFVGMHFFNPVPPSALVEVVIGTATDVDVRDMVVEWVTALGKTGVVVRDSPGFASSRLGVLLGLEAARMVEEGVAEPSAIDQAMELGYRHPMGPLRLTDLVGLDVRLAIADYLRDKLGERFAAPELLRRKVAAGELGRKTGQGFYAWD
ncbi:MAG TPA: 3-hydroxyacyl-CoA dehydrogenase family protein [Pseudonocardiaceae bacterium]|jgi:3-hydroxybutyryl-CoA dehydrogenase|nr:3-hydroxyacyl-CoA dehydrogenase family protein [Pseudonocardiaceae bacterium]